MSYIYARDYQGLGACERDTTERTEASRLYSEGQAYYQAGQHGEAAATFHRINATECANVTSVEAEVASLCMAGSCEQALQLMPRAEELRRHSDQPRRPETQRTFDECRAECERRAAGMAPRASTPTPVSETPLPGVAPGGFTAFLTGAAEAVTGLFDPGAKAASDASAVAQQTARQETGVIWGTPAMPAERKQAVYPGVQPGAAPQPGAAARVALPGEEEPFYVTYMPHIIIGGTLAVGAIAFVGWLALRKE